MPEDAESPPGYVHIDYKLDRRQYNKYKQRWHRDRQLAHVQDLKQQIRSLQCVLASKQPQRTRPTGRIDADLLLSWKDVARALQDDRHWDEDTHESLRALVATRRTMLEALVSWVSSATVQHVPGGSRRGRFNLTRVRLLGVDGCRQQGLDRLTLSLYHNASHVLDKFRVPIHDEQGAIDGCRSGSHPIQPSHHDHLVFPMAVSFHVDTTVEDELEYVFQLHCDLPARFEQVVDVVEDLFYRKLDLATLKESTYIDTELTGAISPSMSYGILLFQHRRVVLSSEAVCPQPRRLLSLRHGSALLCSWTNRLIRRTYTTGFRSNSLYRSFRTRGRCIVVGQNIPEDDCYDTNTHFSKGLTWIVMEATPTGSTRVRVLSVATQIFTAHGPVSLDEEARVRGMDLSNLGPKVDPLQRYCQLYTARPAAAFDATRAKMRQVMEIVRANQTDERMNG